MGLYLTIVVLLHIPAIQILIGQQAGLSLSKKLGTQVTIERIDLGFLNRIIADGLYAVDQKGKLMIKIARFSIKLDVISLIHGDISASAVQLFGLQANFYKESANSNPNFQFILDSLRSNDTIQHSSPIKITSIIVRHGAISYNQLDVPDKKNISLQHLALTDISSHIILNELSKDSISFNIKNLSFKEKKGLHVKSLSLKLRGNTKQCFLENFKLELPRTKIQLEQCVAHYLWKKENLVFSSLQYSGGINQAIIAPNDFAAFMPELSAYQSLIRFNTIFSGTKTSLDIKNLHLVSNADIELSARGRIDNWNRILQWRIDIQKLNAKKTLLEKYMPQQYANNLLKRIEEIQLSGEIAGRGKKISANGIINSNLGSIEFDATINHSQYNGRIKTSNLNLTALSNSHTLGILAADLEFNCQQENSRQLSNVTIKGRFPRFDYNGYSYRNIDLDGTGVLTRNFQLHSLDGTVSIDDPNGKLKIRGKMSHDNSNTAVSFNAEAHNINSSVLQLPDKWANHSLSFRINSSFTGKDFKNATGQLQIKNLSIRDTKKAFDLEELALKIGYDVYKEHYISLNSDFGKALIIGTFDYSLLLQNIGNVIVDKLPSIQHLTPIIKKAIPPINIRLYAEITKSDWAEFFLRFPLSLHQPVHISGSINSFKELLTVNVKAPDFTYNNRRYVDNYLNIDTPNDTLKLNIQANKTENSRKEWTWKVQTAAANDHLITNLAFNNHAAQPLKGSINTETQFFKKKNGEAAAHIIVHPSEVSVQDSIWTIEPSDIVYSDNNWMIDHFAIHYNGQHIIVGGLATKHLTDTLIADFKDVNVSYILDLVDFHSVEFEGLLSGKAHIAGLFSNPQGVARITVDRFRFETGQMGVLDAGVSWNEHEKQLDIRATASDDNHHTFINGYVSPSKHYLYLSIEANNTRLAFLEGFCGSFMRNVEANGNGKLRLYGDLGRLNLTGKVVAAGSLGISSLNTTYELKNDTIHFIPDQIYFKNDTVYDRNGNIAIVSGALRHDNLKNLRYDLNIAAENLLAYDTHSFVNSTFYATAYVTGHCSITGKSGEVNIDVNATPQQGSQIVYNADHQSAIDTKDFIRWLARTDTTASDKSRPAAYNKAPADGLREIPSDLHLNLLINATPDMTLKLIMDKRTGDYIALNGEGGLRATYYNKGNFDLFGNYAVDRGIYRLTIQNIIKKDFQFQQGSTIAFGGDPYNADLHLNALYTINGVSLSDLNIGKSFASNNIRVNCMMNITGTPNNPKVDFSLDLPTINNDAKQMVYSLINSEEEMNQQVVYLLAVGRFYAQGNNNSVVDNPTRNQTNLAMQSLLSGTLSQQFNNVLSTVINNTNWNFGANISTGTEGFNDAEYEGLLSGRLLNNRLLINGQFGYRDNANTTTSFIGDFDIRYLLYPSGNLAFKVYNQTNDRYFTRNSLTTQGIGLILKKDFNSLGDLFRKRQTGRKKTQ